MERRDERGRLATAWGSATQRGLFHYYADFSPPRLVRLAPASVVALSRPHRLVCVARLRLGLQADDPGSGMAHHPATAHDPHVHGHLQPGSWSVDGWGATVPVLPGRHRDVELLRQLPEQQ